MTDQQEPETKSPADDHTPEMIEDLKKKAAERDQYLDLAQRTRAEFENFQKRNRSDRDLERKYAYYPLVRDLLPVLDNLDRALAASQQAGEAGALAKGVAMVQSQFLDLLKRNSVVRIEAQDKPFNPNEHEAVMQKPSADCEPNTVLQVLENGFMLHDRVVRPAKVIVSAKV
jgi:molecular chaperone GrpE